MHHVDSQQVSFWSVHEFVEPWLLVVGSWPMLGTPLWCALDDGDPKKIAAVVDAAQHWALRLEMGQEARAEASRAIASAADWPAISREIHQRNDFYAAKPWMRRRVSQ